MPPSTKIAIALFISVMMLSPLIDVGAQETTSPPPGLIADWWDRGEDLDDDGLFDVLRLGLVLNVVVPDEYNIRTYIHPLEDDLELVIAYREWNGHLEQDPAIEVVIDIPSDAITSSGIPGPYSVDVWVENANGTVRDSVVFQTGPYTLDQFQLTQSRLEILNIRAEAVDHNDNERFDGIFLEARVRFDVEGPVIFGAELMADTGEDEMWHVTEVELMEQYSMGEHLLQLSIPGVDIFESGMDGPYLIRFWVGMDSPDSEENADMAWAESELWTEDYFHDMFESPWEPFRIRSVSEHTRDNTGDGLFEVLELTVDLEIGQSGEFMLFAELSGIFPYDDWEDEDEWEDEDSWDGEEEWVDGEDWEHEEGLDGEEEWVDGEEEWVDGEDWEHEEGLDGEEEWVDGEDWEHEEEWVDGEDWEHEEGLDGEEEWVDGEDWEHEEGLNGEEEWVNGEDWENEEGLNGEEEWEDGEDWEKGEEWKNEDEWEDGGDDWDDEWYEEESEHGDDWEDEPWDEEDLYFPITGWEQGFDLKRGVHKVSVILSGFDIHESGVDGPYFVEFWVVTVGERHLDEELDDGEGFETFLMEHETEPYSFEDFQPAIPAVTFTGNTTHEGLDRDGNDLFEHLQVTCQVEVLVEGRYLLFGELSGEDGWESTFVEREIRLSAKTAWIDLGFCGGEIRELNIDGPFFVFVQIEPMDIPLPPLNGGDDMKTRQDEPPGEPIPGQPPGHPPTGDPDMIIDPPMPYKGDAIEFEVEGYQNRDFEFDENVDIDDSADDNPFLIELGEESDMLQNGNLRVVLEHDRPHLQFSYAQDKEHSTIFDLVISRLLVYRDINGNGVINEGEATHSVELGRINWMVDNVATDNDPELGKVAVYRMETSVDLRAVGGPESQDGLPVTIWDWATLTIEFMVSANDHPIDNPQSFSIAGGEEMSMRVLLDINRPVDADHIAMEYKMDVKGEVHDYEYCAGGEIGKTYSSSVPQSAMILPDPGQNRPILKMVSRSTGDEHGFFAWGPFVNITEMDGRYKYHQVTSNLEITREGLKLQLNYPMPRATRSIVHTPSVGVEEENPIITEKTLADWIRSFNPLIYFLTIVLVAVIIMMAIKSQKRDPELELDAPQRPGSQRPGNNNRPKIRRPPTPRTGNRNVRRG